MAVCGTEGHFKLVGVVWADLGASKPVRPSLAQTSFLPGVVHCIISPLRSQRRDILVPALSLQSFVTCSHRGLRLEEGRQAQGLIGKGFLGENQGN